MLKRLVCAFALVVIVAPWVRAGNVTLAWDANKEADLAGYKLYVGTSARQYGGAIDVGNVTRHTI